MSKSHHLTDQHIEQIIAIVENEMGELVRRAVATVTGFKPAPSKRRKRRTPQARILAVLAKAKTKAFADQYPDLAPYLTLKAMPKSVLRKHVGNSCPGFTEALVSMVSDKTILQRQGVSSKGRRIDIYGLP